MYDQIQGVFLLCLLQFTFTDSGPSNGMTSSLNAHQMSSGASANANGCPAFLPTCPQECVNLDGHGCPICICKGQSNSSGTYIHTSYQYIFFHLTL